MKKSFTLTELLIGIIIIGILVVLGLPNYNKMQEKAFDREVKASLALMRAAERIYKMEIGFWYPNSGTVTDIGAINTNLKLSLPTASPKWNYSVVNDVVGDGIIRGTRSGGAFIRIWTWNSSNPSDDIPNSACTGNCL